MAAGGTMQGRRLPDARADGVTTFTEGDYCKVGDEWWIRPPRSHLGTLDPQHNVIEHEDGTITVSPSIQGDPTSGLIEGQTWHGYLERGVWREV